MKYFKEEVKSTKEQDAQVFDLIQSFKTPSPSVPRQKQIIDEWYRISLETHDQEQALTDSPCDLNITQQVKHGALGQCSERLKYEETTFHPRERTHGSGNRPPGSGPGPVTGSP